MYLVYVDDSKDRSSCCFSAIFFPSTDWNKHFAHLKGIRQQMKASDGIYVTKELHATDFLGGRGRIAPTIIPKRRRAALFNWYLQQIGALPGVSVINACMSLIQEETAFEWMLNRIERTMVTLNDHALIISDEGKSYDSMLRRMRHFNYIPSAYGAWSTGAPSQNMRISNIIEDLVYRDSKRSLFIQAADFCAYSLLRFINPTSAAHKFGFDTSFRHLDPVLFKEANRKCRHGLGIVGQ